MEKTSALLKIEYVEEIIGKQLFSELISEHLENMYEKTNVYRYRNLAERMRVCGKSWFFGEYKKQETFDLRSINYCKSKFCPICQTAMQASKLRKYIPVIERKAEDYDIYHCILTRKNVNGQSLNDTIEIMLKAFPKLIRYFKLDSKVKGIDFEPYGYNSAFRSLEITYKADDYHPHLHCIFAMKKDLNFKHYIKNKFSKSRHSPNETYLFSEFEIQLQKIWYLLNNGIKVTKKSIEELQLGYSCQFKKIEDGKYGEVFKYASQIFDEDCSLIDERQFKTLFKALDERRMFQGYGAFVRIKEDVIDESYDVIYNNIINKLNSVEKAVMTSFQSDKLQNKLKYSKHIFICRKAIYSVWQELQQEGIELEPDMISTDFLKRMAKEEYKYQVSTYKRIFKEHEYKDFNKLLSLDVHKKKIALILEESEQERKRLDKAKAEGKEYKTAKQIEEQTSIKLKKLYKRMQALIDTCKQDEFIQAVEEERIEKESYKDRLKRILLDEYEYSKRKTSSPEYRTKFKYKNEYERSGMTESHIIKLIKEYYKKAAKKDKIYSAIWDVCVIRSFESGNLRYAINYENYKEFTEAVRYFKTFSKIHYDAIVKDFDKLIRLPEIVENQKACQMLDKIF